MKFFVLAVLSIPLSGCIGPSFATLDTNVPEGKYARTLGLFALANPVDSDRAQTGGFMLRALESDGVLASSDTLVWTLEKNGFFCKPISSGVGCRGEFYRVERVRSGSPDDGNWRADWFISVKWQDRPGPVHPEIRGGRFKDSKIQ
jgi:hypothetical protein